MSDGAAVDATVRHDAGGGTPGRRRVARRGSASGALTGVLAGVLAVVLAAGALGLVPGGSGPRPAAAAAPASVEFAVIGDFGTDSTAEAQVAAMVRGWNPAFVATTGDNYYAAGSETGTDRYDRVVGGHYCDFLAGVAPGPRCPSGGTSTANRFFPATGNHDWTDGDITNYRAYFALPGSELVYDVRQGPVHLFFLDSQAALASGAEAARQQSWLQAALAASSAPWQIVVLHHPPYSSGAHGSSPALRWPFAQWGADLVLSGHDHTYERVGADGLVYLVNGLGGAPRYSFGATPVTGSVVRDASDWGALRVRADATALTSEFVGLSGAVVDRVVLSTPTTTPPTTTPPTTIRLQDGVSGYSGTRDTTLAQATPTTVLGAAPTLLVDGDDPPGSGQDLAMLVRFDLSSIPAGAVVQSAALTFDVVNTSTHSYPAYEVLRAWDEATATWTQASAGVPWGAAGASGGTDRGAALGTLTAPSLGASTLTFDANGRAAVQAWVSGTRANHGLVIAAAAPTDGADVTSREGATVAARPALVVTYTGGGTAPPTTPPPTTPPSTTPTSPVWDAGCTGRLVATSPGTVTDPALREISGIVASVRTPGVWWVHNDSGDTARVFALSGDGRTLGQFTLAGVTARDWEDLAIGPGPVAGTPYLYLGDIGDNSLARTSIVIHRIAEPAVSAATTGTSVTLGGVETLTLRYPDGPRNAEALLVDPTSGTLVLVTKTSSGAAEVYTAPGGLVAGSTATLTRVSSFSPGVVTGADVTRAGDVVALRTYSSVLLYQRPAGADLAAALGTRPCTAPSASESQGEAIGFLPDGSGYLTVSEGAQPPLRRFAPPTTTPPTTRPGAFRKSSPANRATVGATPAARSTSTVTLQWAASTGVTVYEVCLDRDGNSTCDTSWVSVGSATRATFPVTPGRNFSWQVRARNAGGTTVADGGTWWRFLAR